MLSGVTGVFVSVDVLAREHGTSEDEIVRRIRDGELVGRKHGTGWEVLVQAPRPADASTMPAPPPPHPDETPYVVVTDVQIPYWALASFLIKLVLAFIPLLVIAFGVAFVAWRYGDLIDALLSRLL